MNGHADDIDMNGIPSFDSCGYESGMILSVDSRNLKWQAKQNGEYVATANKAHNYKDYAKYMKRRQAKEERQEAKHTQE